MYDIPANVVNNVLYYPGIKNIKRNVMSNIYEFNNDFYSIGFRNIF